MINANKIRTLSGNKPHESWKGWEDFLTSCEVRGKVMGCIWYGTSNCNYFVFADNTLFENYGYHANNLWQQIQKEGAEIVLVKIKETYWTIEKINHALQSGNWKGAKEAAKTLAAD